MLARRPHDAERGAGFRARGQHPVGACHCREGVDPSWAICVRRVLARRIEPGARGRRLPLIWRFASTSWSVLSTSCRPDMPHG
jgi:hypothetical protein